MKIEATEDVQTVDEARHCIVKADTPVYGGYVISRNGKVIFIKGAIPGEVVEVSIEEKKRDYITASVKKVVEPSPFRRTPPCVVYGTCGGCQLQHIQYERQIAIKEEILVETLKRIGDVEVSLMPSLSDREFGYRQRGQFKVSKAGEIGFFREGTREVIAVDACPLMTDEINESLRKIASLQLKGLREVHISAGDSTVVLIKGPLTEGAAQEMLDSGIGGIALENGDSLGKDYVTLDLNGLEYSVTPWGFFQSHWSLNRKVVAMVVEALAPLSGLRVLDLYAGAGNFALPLSLQAEEVIAIEESGPAVEDARRNSALNGIKNCTFIQSSVERALAEKKKKQLNSLFTERGIDTVILDPPRPGLTSPCVGRLLELESRRIVYVSCNPATLARDVRKLREKYDVSSAVMVDFFPNTYHIEVVLFLVLRGS